MYPITTITIQREVPTNTGRIDLIIETEKILLVIVNKIKAKLNNDLDEYITYANNHYKKEI